MNDHGVTAGQRFALIAEDDSDIRELVTAKLAGAGYRVLAVADGIAAAAAVADEVPDVALLDVMMPGLSGIELLAELRRNPRTAGVPVILLSARSQEFDIDAGIASGAADYIVKPFSPRELLQRIDAALDRTAP